MRPSINGISTALKSNIATTTAPAPATSSTSGKVQEFMEKVIAKDPGEREFHQAVREVVESVMPLVQATPAYQKARILERLVEPERVIMFRVPWVDDRGDVQVNRGYRVQMNSAIGPYKG
jgi:glutamate dehydrogenase (NADP+)